MKRDIEIPAIHDNNLINILTDLNILDKINEKKLRCANCGEIITLDNLAGIRKLKNDVLLICDNPECIFIEANKSIS